MHKDNYLGFGVTAQFIRTRRSLCRLLALVLLGLMPVAWAQDSLTPVRFTLDWAIQGPQAFFLMAQELGYFAEEGLEVSIDRGFGSAGTVAQIAGGAYDIGFADINSMIEFNVQNPDEALQAVAVVYNYPAFSIISLAGRGIESPEDLVGASIGAPVFDSAFRTFPLFADAVGIDPDSVSWEAMDPALREPSLLRGDVDAIAGFHFTAIMNLEAAGVASDDIVTFLYGELGVDAYGNAIMAPQAFIDENPEVVSGMLRALTRAWHDMLADPEEAIAFVQRADSLIDPEVELSRLLLAIETNMLTPEVAEVGFGGVDPERLERSIAQIVEIFSLESTPELESIFTDAFLPPQGERLPR